MSTCLHLRFIFCSANWLFRAQAAWTWNRSKVLHSIAPVGEAQAAQGPRRAILCVAYEVLAPECRPWDTILNMAQLYPPNNRNSWGFNHQERGSVACWGRKKHPNKHGLYHVSGCESPLQRPGADRMILLMESLFCSPNSRHIPLGWYIYTHISCWFLLLNHFLGSSTDNGTTSEQPLLQFNGPTRPHQ
jgi:hypothetical protein